MPTGIFQLDFVTQQDLPHLMIIEEQLIFLKSMEHFYLIKVRLLEKVKNIVLMNTDNNWIDQKKNSSHIYNVFKLTIVWLF